MFIDCHLHWQAPQLLPRLEEMIAECSRQGIESFISAGTDENDWPQLKKVVDRYSTIYPAYGLHPWLVAQKTDSWLQTLEGFLTDGGIAVGEIGIDRKHIPSAPKLQEEVFCEQWKLAYRLKLPAIVHCVRASDWLLSLLKVLPPLPYGFMMHGFSCSKDDLFKLLDKGAYVSFVSNIMKPHKQALRDTLGLVPDDRLLTETDAPYCLPPAEYCPPQYRRELDNKINHPGNLATLVKFMARLRQQDSLELQNIVRHNARQLFPKLK